MSEQRKFSAELHGLRGLAAMMVVLSHSTLIATDSPFIGYVREFMNSPGAVTIFFIMSGLVLALSLQRIKLSPSTYFYWELRRFFRLIPLLFFCVTAGTIVINYFHPVTNFSFMDKTKSDEFDKVVTIKQYIGGMIGAAPRADPPIWSIFVEIMASLLLPLFVFYSRFNIGKALISAALLILSVSNLHQIHNWNYYMLDFYVGVSVLWWGPYFANYFQAKPRYVTWIFVAVLTLAFILWRRVLGQDYYGGRIVNLGEMLIVAPVIALIYYGQAILSFLKMRVFVFLGEISYSVYLTHFIIQFIVLDLMVFIYPQFQTMLNLFQVFLTLFCCVVTVATSYVTWKYIEQPGINLGYKFSAFLKKSNIFAKTDFI